jgi:hypothetical protein
MPYAKDVFLSYTGLEREIAETIYQDLTDYGANVWFDKTDMPAGHNNDPNVIRHHLRVALTQSRSLLLLMSGRSAASRWVRFEMDTLVSLEAARNSRRIIVLLVGQGSARDVPAALSDCKIHDLRDHFSARYRKYREEIFGDVLRELDRSKFRRIFD